MDLLNFIKSNDKIIIFIKSFPKENKIVFVDLRRNVYIYDFSTKKLLLTFQITTKKFELTFILLNLVSN